LHGQRASGGIGGEGYSIGLGKATTSEIRTLDERWLGVEVPEAAPA